MDNWIFRLTDLIKFFVKSTNIIEFITHSYLINDNKQSWYTENNHCY